MTHPSPAVEHDGQREPVEVCVRVSTAVGRRNRSSRPRWSLSGSTVPSSSAMKKLRLVSASTPTNCTQLMNATASVGSWSSNGGRTPSDTNYPYVHYEVPFTDAERQLFCGRHALNGADGRVITGYTDLVGSVFAFERQCGVATPAPIVEAPRLTCTADVQGLGDTECIYTETPSGVSVDFNGTCSQANTMPDGLELDDCCLNLCCEA